MLGNCNLIFSVKERQNFLVNIKRRTHSDCSKGNLVWGCRLLCQRCCFRKIVFRAAAG